ncbi:MAG: barstar family protein [Bacteroidia bacterium]
MELFTNDIELDLQILQNGAISMYHDQIILDKDLNELKKLDYQIADFNTSTWTPTTAHQELKNGLDFPAYYGENLDALNDCLGDLNPTDQKGLVIVFRHFDNIATTDKEWCEGLLDVITEQSRQWLLTNKRLIGLIQSDDPDLSFSKLGGLNPTWNGEEWIDDKRRKNEKARPHNTK